MFVAHPFLPVWNASSRILILGSFPSVKSRETAFYYGHPQNRFWKVMAAILKESVPESVPQKLNLLKKHHIALWDIAASCEIQGSSDSSMKDVKINDISPILNGAPIAAIFANGQTCANLYKRFALPKLGRGIIPLPSTSPANAAASLKKLIECWQIITQYADLGISPDAP